MCDKELLLGYLYDDLSAVERKVFDAHVATCADCRDELAGLRSTRSSLTAWAPPEPDLGFEIVRGGAKSSASRGAWWRLSPAWGLAAAALLTLAVAAAVANLEVRMGAEGLVVRTGWDRGTSGPVDQATTFQTVSASDVQKLEARLKDLEGQVSARPAAVATVSTLPVNRMSDAEIVRLVRQSVSESEQRQQGLLASRILQVSRDTEAARRSDVDRMLTFVRQVQGAGYETSQRQRALEDHLVRVGLQR